MESPDLGPDLPDLRKARALWMLNRFDESLQLFDKVVRRCPQNLMALIDASRAFGTRFEIARAENLLDQLCKLGAHRADVLHLAGQSYRMIYRPDKAMDCFQRVLAITREIPDAQLELAVLYERRHRLEDARALIEDCLRADPEYAEARLMQARLMRRMEEETASESILRSLTSNEQAHPLVRAQAWAELAQGLDRRGDYDEAMSTMLCCKEILLQHEGTTRRESEVVQSHLQKLAQSCTAAHFQRWHEAGPASSPHQMALLTSFPRSGTTLLEQVLDSHPGLISSDERETFARDIFPALWQTAATPLPSADVLDAITPQRLAAQRERYWAYMEAALQEPIGHRVHLDKNPSYTFMIPAMLRLFPETKLIIALRDPRDVVMSCFMQYLPLNTNSVCFLTLERTVRRYSLDMTVWQHFRSIIQSPWLEIRYEDCVADLGAEARRALQFLGLPWDPQVMNYRERLKEKAVNSPTYEAVSQPVYTRAVGRWRNYARYLEPQLELLQPMVEAFGYKT